MHLAQLMQFHAVKFHWYRCAQIRTMLALLPFFHLKMQNLHVRLNKMSFKLFVITDYKYIKMRLSIIQGGNCK